MPETAQPLLLRFKKFVPLVSKTTKLIFVFNIFLVSSLSGQIEFLNEMGRRGQTFAETERKLPDQKFAAESSSNVFINNSKTSFETYDGGIRQVSIGMSEVPSPTPTIIPVPSKSVLSAETKEGVWGVAEKIDTHTYTMRVEPDDSMGNAGEILAALNSFRQRHGRGVLAWDDKLAEFASSRANFFADKGTLDKHQGFLDYVNNQDGFKKLGFSSVGENSSLGFHLTGVHLIEWVYAGDEEHNSNQLSSEWQYVGIGVNGTATDLVFAAGRM